MKLTLERGLPAHDRSQAMTSADSDTEDAKDTQDALVFGLFASCPACPASRASTRRARADDRGPASAGFKREAGVAASAVPPPLREIGFDQNLDQRVPLDTTFRDEAGATGAARRLLRQEAGRAGVRVLRLPDALHAGAQRPVERARRDVARTRARTSRSSPSASTRARRRRRRRRRRRSTSSATSGPARPRAGTS